MAISGCGSVHIVAYQRLIVDKKIIVAVACPVIFLAETG
jgi:hypothetical protein